MAANLRSLHGNPTDKNTPEATMFLISSLPSSKGAIQSRSPQAPDYTEVFPTLTRTRAQQDKRATLAWGRHMLPTFSACLRKQVDPFLGSLLSKALAVMTATPGPLAHAAPAEAGHVAQVGPAKMAVSKDHAMDLTSWCGSKV